MNVYIKTTESCNLRCRHCYTPPHKSPSLDISKTAAFLSGLNDIDPSNYFILHGGEPMMCDSKKILSLLDMFPNNRWRISTNLCYSLTDERLMILKRMKEVRVSFDCEIRFGTIENLLLWLSNIRTLVDLKIPIFLNICLTTYLLRHSAEQLLSVIDRLGIARYSFERITCVGNAKEHRDMIPTYSDVERFLTNIYELERTRKYLCRCENIKLIRLGIEQHCIYTYGKDCCHNTLTINADGSIGNCPNDATVRLVGNIDSSTSDVCQNIRKQKHSTKSQCLCCQYFKWCRGFCEQIEWQNDICPYPKKLAEAIYRNEYHTNISV